MTEEAKQIMETLKQADKVFDAMELPEEEYAFTFDRYAAMTLVAEIERLERERDAAVKEIKDAERCGSCKHYYSGKCDGWGKCGYTLPNWQWRGAKR